jgi:hypothetical protein
MDEILVSLKGMENSKSPGPDGLTKEFYFKFIDIFGPMLNTYNIISNYRHSITN